MPDSACAFVNLQSACGSSLQSLPFLVPPMAGAEPRKMRAGSGLRSHSFLCAASLELLWRLTVVIATSIVKRMQVPGQQMQKKEQDFAQEVAAQVASTAK